MGLSIKQQPTESTKQSKAIAEDQLGIDSVNVKMWAGLKEKYGAHEDSQTSSTSGNSKAKFLEKDDATTFLSSATGARHKTDANVISNTNKYIRIEDNTGQQVIFNSPSGALNRLRAGDIKGIMASSDRWESNFNYPNINSLLHAPQLNPDQAEYLGSLLSNLYNKKHLPHQAAEIREQMMVHIKSNPQYLARANFCLMLDAYTNNIDKPIQLV